MTPAALESEALPVHPIRTDIVGGESSDFKANDTDDSDDNDHNNPVPVIVTPDQDMETSFERYSARQDEQELLSEPWLDDFEEEIVFELAKPTCTEFQVISEQIVPTPSPAHDHNRILFMSTPRLQRDLMTESKSTARSLF